MFLSLVPLLCGGSFANFFLESCIKRFGLHKVILFQALSASLTCFICSVSVWISLIYLSYFISGINHQTIIFVSISLINQKYSSRQVEFTGYVFTSTAFCSLFWGLVSKLVLNPWNLTQVENGLTPSAWSISSPRKSLKGSLSLWPPTLSLTLSFRCLLSSQWFFRNLLDLKTLKKLLRLKIRQK